MTAFQLLGLTIVAGVAFWFVRDTLGRAAGKRRRLAAIQIGVFAIMAAVFVYGLIFFIDAPIRPCGNGFCGKTGIAHTAAEYHDFAVWERTLLITWIVGVPIHFGLLLMARLRASAR
jgi:hypothetical protein